MKKNTLKIILDSIMALVLMFMYKKNVFGLSFHEIAGVAVCLLFIVHILLNRKWVVAATKSVFHKGTPGKIRAGYIVDFLIALSFLGLLVTGIGISKAVFSPLAFLGNAGNPFHFLFGGLSLILLGVHLGLHWDWIKSSILKFYAKSPKWVHSVLTLVAIAFSGYGVYCLVNSSMGRWLSAVFVGGGSPYANGAMAAGAAGHGAGGAMAGGANAAGAAQAGVQAGGAMAAGGPGMHGAESITASSVVGTFFVFLAIVVFFAFVTVMVESLVTRKKKETIA